MERALLDAVGSGRDALIDFAGDLISIPTENPPGRSYRQCVDRISSELTAIGIGHEIVTIPVRAATGSTGGFDAGAFPRYGILGSLGSGKKVLHFHGHYDVVPAACDSQLEPRIDNGKLYGRGSSDMKGGLAAMIYAVRAVRVCGIDLDGRLALTIVPDEETGGRWGSGHFADTGVLGRDGIGMLTPEPTGGVVWNASRGAITLRISVVGKPTHVVTHYDGSNAFERMIELVNRLLELKGEVTTRKTRFRVQPDEARNSILMIGGRCEGGTNFNVVPGRCSFTIERRFNPEESLEEERARLFAVIDQVRSRGIDIEVEVIQEGDSSCSAEDEAVGRALAGAIETVTGSVPAFELCPGLLETRYYSSIGVPAYGYGPGLLSVSHGPAEYVVIEDIEICTAVYATVVARLLGS